MAEPLSRREALKVGGAGIAAIALYLLFSNQTARAAIQERP